MADSIPQASATPDGDLTHGVFAQQKLAAEIKQLEVRTRWEESKAFAEIEEIRKPFYLRPPFFAALAAVSGLVFTWASGWFDAKNDKLEAERRLLDFEVKALTAERDALEGAEAEFKIRKSGLQSDESALATSTIALSEAQAALAKDVLAYTGELSKLESDKAALAAARTAVDQETREVVMVKAALAREQALLVAEREAMATRMEKQGKQIPFDLALGDLLATNPYDGAARAGAALALALEKAGELRNELLPLVEQATQQPTTQAVFVELCLLLWEQTQDEKWLDQIAGRLATEPIEQQSGYRLSGPRVLGEARFYELLRTVVAKSIAERPTQGGWYAMESLMAWVNGKAVDILGAGQVLDLAQTCLREIRSGGDSLLSALEVLEAIGPHPCNAALASVLQASPPIADRYEYAQLLRFVLEQPASSGIPMSVDSEHWAEWHRAASTEVDVWLEDGLASLRKLSAEDLRVRCGFAPSGSIRASDVPYLDTARMATRIEEGTLIAAPPQAGESTSYLFELVVEGTGRYVIDTYGNVDVTLTVYRGNGTFLAADDDSGEGLNASVTVALESGTYKVAVVAADHADLQPGAFGIMWRPVSD